jgi:shikimate kinase
VSPVGPVGTILLVGLMGSGKSTVARLVGEATGRAVLDTDEMVEAAAGMSVRRIIETLGEADFRARERTALVEALDRGDVVVAAAGGSVCSAESAALVRARRAARACVVVWLTAPLAELALRTASGEHRPALDDGAEVALARMAAERSEIYADLADIVVDTGGSKASEVARRVVLATGASSDVG